MERFYEVLPADLGGNLFRMIGEQWMLIGAKQGSRVNMMTASWGGAGILWNRPVVYVFIRPQRFTREFVDETERFSCTFFPPGEYREELTLCGRKSGRDIDKVAACGFQVLDADGVPYFAQCSTALICKTLYRQRLEPGNFLVPECEEQHYPQKDYHYLYVAEIEKALVRES